jgi:hypothetical protein
MRERLEHALCAPFQQANGVYLDFQHCFESIGHKYSRFWAKWDTNHENYRWNVLDHD